MSCLCRQSRALSDRNPCQLSALRFEATSRRELVVPNTGGDRIGISPGSEHVTRLGLQTADDSTLWRYARDHGFVVVTQDSDFHELAMLHGSPPKIIWLKCGNRPRWYVASLLLKHRDEINAFGKDADSSVVEIIN